MTQIHVLHWNNAHRCYTTETGVDRHQVGCAHERPRDAINHVDALAARAGQDEHDSLDAVVSGTPVQPESPE